MALTDEDLKNLGDVEVLPRAKAEFEFDRRFEKTRSNQSIARVTVTRFFKKYGKYWLEVKPEDMVEI